VSGGDQAREVLRGKEHHAMSGLEGGARKGGEM